MAEPAFFLAVPLLAASAAWLIARVGPHAEPGRRLPDWAAPACFALAAAAFFVQPALRHWQFGSGAKDMGLFVQQHWLLAHGHVPYNTILDMHMFADHLTFIDVLVAPLFRLWDGAETLLLVQALGVASAVFPLVGLGRALLDDERAGLVAAGAWLLSPEVHSGLMFDYNPGNIGAAGLIWTAWALVARGPVLVALAAIFTCACKTNLDVYVAVLALGLALLRAVAWKRALPVAAAALALFAVEIGVVFPMFREGGFRHWDYQELGPGPAEISAQALRHPQRTAALLVDNEEKRRSLLLPLLTTGFLGLAEPLTLLLQLPNWAERILSTHPNRWWGYYYGVPAAATACIGLLFGWRRLRRAGRGRGLSVYVLASALLAGAAPPWRSSPAGNPRSDLYALRQPHTSAREDVETQRRAVAFVGKDPTLRVAAQFRLLPHLAQRPFVVTLDRAAEADLVVLQVNGDMHPWGRPGWRRQLREALRVVPFHVAFCEGLTVVLRRGRGTDVPCPAWERELPHMAP